MKSAAYIVLASVLVFAFATSALAQECDHDHDHSDGHSHDTKEAAATATATAKKGEKVTNPIVVFQTNYGDIKFELFMKEAPISTENFLGYVNDGFFDGTTFHRVIPKFVIQAGGINADMKQKAKKPGIKNEATNGLKNKRGTLSMARTADINSGSSHFFVNLSDNASLDHRGMDPASYGYAVFGKVADDASMKIVDKIAQVKTTTKGGHKDVPVDPVTIKKAAVVGADKTAEKAAEDTKKVAEDKVKKEQKQMKEE